MKRTTLSILLALFVITAQFARAGELADAFLLRPEAPRAKAKVTVDTMPDDLRQPNPYEVRPYYPARSREEIGAPESGGYDERNGDPIYRGFPPQVIGAQ